MEARLPLVGGYPNRYENDEVTFNGADITLVRTCPPGPLVPGPTGHYSLTSTGLDLFEGFSRTSLDVHQTLTGKR